MNLSRHVSRHTSAYRALLRAYPRSFRRDYGEPMTQLFADRVRDVGAKTWLRVVPDLARTVPQQRIEAFMNNSKARVPVFVVMAVVGVAAIVGTGGPGIIFVAAITLTYLLLTQAELISSLFRSDRVSLRRAVMQQWWAPIAAVVGVVEIIAGIGNALYASNWGGRVFGSTVLIAMGLGMLYALARRPFARAGANGMILVMTLPFFVMFWMVLPPLVGIVVWVGVIRDGFDHERVPAPATR